MSTFHFSELFTLIGVITVCTTAAFTCVVRNRRRKQEQEARSSIIIKYIESGEKFDPRLLFGKLAEPAAVIKKGIVEFLIGLALVIPGQSGLTDTASLDKLYSEPELYVVVISIMVIMSISGVLLISFGAGNIISQAIVLKGKKKEKHDEQGNR